MTIPKNPYIAGNPVGGTGAFIGRADVLREVTGVLHNPNRNAIVLYGQRRIGKTSVLQELKRQLVQEGKYFPVYMDLQDKAAWPLEKLLRALAQEISAALPTEVTLPESGDIPTAFRETYIPQVLAELPADAAIILLLDEFDVLDNPEQGQAGADFFPYLRTFLEAKEGRLQFVFVIGRKPEDLSNLTLSVFKGVRSKRVSLLPQKDTWALVRLAERNHTLVWTEEALQAVWDLTHGHPYLTQQLCEIVWENAYEAAEDDAPPAVGEGAVHAAVPETLESSANALQWLWDGLPAAEKYVAAVLAEAGPQPVTQDELVHRLEESGVRIVIHELQNAPQILKEWDLLEETPEGYRFQVELLRRWIAAKKPVQQVYQELENIKPLAQNLYETGRRYYQSGELDEAVDQLRKALGANPNHVRAGLLLAQILFAQEQVDEAVVLLEQIYAYNPGLARPHLVQALLKQTEATEDEEARWERYARILEINPGQREAMAGRRAILKARAERAAQAGNVEEALALYHQLAAEFSEEGRWEEDIARLEEQRQLPAYYTRAQEALAANNAEEAKEWLQKIVALDPSYPHALEDLLKLTRGIDVNELAVQSGQLEETKQALEDTKKAPKTKERSYERAKTLVANLQKENANSRATQDEPTRWWAWVLGGVVLLMLLVGGGVVLRGWNLPPSPVPTGIAVPSPTWTLTAAPTSTPTSTFTPTLTPMPTPTLTPTPVLPVGAGTPLPQPAAAISSENAEQVIQLARWGKGTVNQVTYSPDGQLLAVASSNGVYLYDAQTREKAHFLETNAWMTSVAFSPDGRTLASGAADNTVRLWRVLDGTLLRTLEGHTGKVTSVAFSPDGRTLASGSSDDTVRLWQVSDGTLLRTLRVHTREVTSVVFSPDGQTLASGSNDRTVRLWQVSDGALLRTLRVHTHEVTSVAFSPDGKTLASGSNDRTVRLWQVSDGALLHTLKAHTDSVTSVAFSPDGKTLASGSNDRTVRLWQVSGGVLIHTLEGHTNWVTSVAFSPDGETLVSGATDNTVRLWGISDGTLLRILEGHTDEVTSVAFSPDGRTLASGAADNIVRLWRVSDGTLLRTLEGHTDDVTSVAFSPDGQTLASGAADNTVRLWRVSDGTLLRTLKGHTGEVTSVAFSPDGETLASGAADNTVRLWRMSDGTLLHILKRHIGKVTSVAFSPDGRTLASGSSDDTVRLWQVSDGTLLHTLRVHTREVTGVVFSPDGQTLASGSNDRTVRLWQVSDGALLCTLRVHTHEVTSVAFSPDGKTLASGSNDDTVRLWRVSDGALLHTLKAHTDSVTSVAFSPDGRLLASGSQDVTVRLWRVP